MLLSKGLALMYTLAFSSERDIINLSDKNTTRLRQHTLHRNLLSFTRFR